MTGSVNDKYLVSVIMPAFNAEKHIQESIESVIRQTYAYWELIIIDDGSTDNTASIIKKFTGTDNRIKYFYQENSRQGRARNLAIKNSSGKYLAFLDADDLWVPEKLYKQINCIQEKGVDLVFSALHVFKGNISDTDHERMNTFRGILRGEEGLKLFFEVNRISILTVLAKRESIMSAGNFIEDLSVQNAEDYHLWMKMILNGSVLFGMEEALAYYRIHENQNTKHDRLVPLQSINAIRNLNINDNNSNILRREYLLKWYKYLLMNYKIEDKLQYKNILKCYFEDTGRRFQFIILSGSLKIAGLTRSVSIFKKYFI